MHKNYNLVLETLRNCCDSENLNSCDKCAYRAWSKEFSGDWRCRNFLMKDALDILTDKGEEIKEIKKISKVDSKDISDFFKKLVKQNKHLLFEAGLNGGEIYSWSTGKSTPKLSKFVSVVKACGYDIKIVRNEEV